VFIGFTVARRAQPGEFGAVQNNLTLVVGVVKHANLGDTLHGGVGINVPYQHSDWGLRTGAISRDFGGQTSVAVGENQDCAKLRYSGVQRALSRSELSNSLQRGLRAWREGNSRKSEGRAAPRPRSDYSPQGTDTRRTAGPRRTDTRRTWRTAGLVNFALELT